MAASVLDSPVTAVDRLDRGLIHQSWTVSAGGDKYMLQYATAGTSASASLQRKVRAYTLAAGTEIPVPAVVSDGVCPWRDADSRYLFYVAEHLPGTPLDIRCSPSHTRQAAGYLSAVHDLRSFDSPGWIQIEEGEMVVDPFDAESWEETVAGQMAENRGAMHPYLSQTTVQQLEDFMDRFGSRLPGQVTPVLCHNDFSPDNILASEEAITGILDFDFIVAAHADRDLVKTANSFHLTNGTDRDVVYTAYDDQKPLSTGFDQWEPLYRVTTLLEIVSSWIELADHISEDQMDHLVTTVEDTVDAACRELGGEE